MVEILCGALAGGQFGWEASSFLDDRGPPPGVGQVLIAFDPAAFSGPEFLDRMADVLAAVAGEPGVRLPGDRRLASREQRAARRVSTSRPSLHAQLSQIGAERSQPLSDIVISEFMDQAAIDAVFEGRDVLYDPEAGRRQGSTVRRLGRLSRADRAQPNAGARRSARMPRHD